MEKTKFEQLKDCFADAKYYNANYIAVLVKMPDSSIELIANKIGSVQTKLDYYEKTYDENLRHRHVKGIEIIDFGWSTHFGALNTAFFGMQY